MIQKGEINREDMLELTRRMTLSRNCFSRIAGAYFDGEGFVDGTFNRHFLKLSKPDQTKNLAIAKAIPFSETNTQLKEYSFTPEERKPGSVWQLLQSLRKSELKNDALLDVYYEAIGEKLQMGRDYAFYLFYGSYDVPLKASDKERLWESEEVYSFLIGAVCPVSGDYEPGEPVSGFLYPAFVDRSADENKIDIFQLSGADIRDILKM
ncbi:MAG: DUF4317 family protein [Eubacteriales bacterium]|nr:DUF4317 family protein [Eubacteriales bacterium]